MTHRDRHVRPCEVRALQSEDVFRPRVQLLTAVCEQRLVHVIIVVVIKDTFAVGHRPHCAARREGT